MLDVRLEMIQSAGMKLRNPTTGKKIRLLRLERGLSQEALAAAAKISRPTLHRYERGDIARTDGLEQIARALGVGVYELMGMDPSAERNFTVAENVSTGYFAVEAKSAATDADVRAIAFAVQDLTEAERRNFLAHMNGYLAALRSGR